MNACIVESWCDVYAFMDSPVTVKSDSEIPQKHTYDIQGDGGITRKHTFNIQKWYLMHIELS